MSNCNNPRILEALFLDQLERIRHWPEILPELSSIFMPARPNDEQLEYERRCMQTLSESVAYKLDKGNSSKALFSNYDIEMLWDLYVNAAFPQFNSFDIEDYQLVRKLFQSVYDLFLKHFDRILPEGKDFADYYTKALTEISRLSTKYDLSYADVLKRQTAYDELTRALYTKTEYEAKVHQAVDYFPSLSDLSDFFWQTINRKGTDPKSRMVFDSHLRPVLPKVKSKLETAIAMNYIRTYVNQPKHK